MRNTPRSEQALLRDAAQVIRNHLPAGWLVGEPTPAKTADEGVDAFVQVTAPDRRGCVLAVEAKTRLEPNRVAALVERARRGGRTDPLVVVAPWLGARTRDLLTDQGVGYADLTGNVRIALTEPGLYLRSDGAAGDPDGAERSVRTLRGPKAGRVVRALIDSVAPPGVRELAAAASIDPGYVSRVLSLLVSEAFVERVKHGKLTRVDWPGLLRRWATEAPLASRGRDATYLAPRGLPHLLTRLSEVEERYAITGGLAAAALAPLAPPRLAMLWTTDARLIADRLGLREAAAGANVVLIEPLDELVFEGVVRRSGLPHVAPSQAAADLLTSPGRGPAEGEELIEWMTRNEPAWRH